MDRTIRHARPRPIGRIFALVVIATVFCSVGLSPVGAVGAAAATPDPIVGDWNVTYGAPAVVTMTLSGGLYTVTAKTPVEVTGATCYLPIGTTIATFSSTGPNTYSGQHGLWYTSNCSFGQWDPMTLTLSSDGNTLTAVLAGGYGTVVFTKASVPGTPGPPSNVIVQPENGNAFLLWQPPADPGTSPITGYVITATPYANSDYYAKPQVVTTSVSVTGSGSQSGTITGLLADCHQEYIFTVSAVNAAGTGPPSAYGTALLPSQPSPPDATGSPPHFRTSGIVAQADNVPPVVVVTVDGFGSQYFLKSNGNPKTTTVDPLVGVNASGAQHVDSSGNGLPISYCVEGEQGVSPLHVNASVPGAIWPTDYHFDAPGFDPGFVNNGRYVKTHHYLLDQLVEYGGIALPYSYTSAATLSASATGVPKFTFTGYTQDKSSTQDPKKDVKLLAKEVDSIHNTWPFTKIVLLGHSGGGLVVEQYWQNYQYSARNVQLAVSVEGPINGTRYAGLCSPHCPSAGGFGDKVVNFLGQQWQNQVSNDAAILSRDSDGTFVAISTEGDSAYGFNTNGLFDSIVPDSVFPCDVTSSADQVNSCNPAQPSSFVDGGQWRSNDPCQWTSDLQNLGFGGQDGSHFYAIGCPQNVDHIRSLINPG